jgi:hypothetical protein
MTGGVWSNCLFWALPRYLRNVRRWRAVGAPQGFEPALVIRPSRSEPSWIPHFLLGSDYEITQMVHGELQNLPELASFKPIDPTDVPAWKAWTHLLFEGHVRRGDFPETKPSDNVPLDESKRAP